MYTYNNIYSIVYPKRLIMYGDNFLTAIISVLAELSVEILWQTRKLLHWDFEDYQ
jgi:hypothetical protein